MQTPGERFHSKQHVGSAAVGSSVPRCKLYHTLLR